MKLKIIISLVTLFIAGCGGGNGGNGSTGGKPPVDKPTSPCDSKLDTGTPGRVAASAYKIKAACGLNEQEFAKLLDKLGYN